MIADIRLIVSLILLVGQLTHSDGLFCGDQPAVDDPHAVCFLEKTDGKAGRLKTSGTSLVLPCHVSRSKEESVVEWWFVSADKQYQIRIHPVFPAVRPVALRFGTSLSSQAKALNETNVVDASILLRNINVDDSGFYTCLVRSLSSEPVVDKDLLLERRAYPMVQYQLEITAPRLCQLSPSTLPCFSSMRSSSPTLVDAFQTTFLQCVVNSFNRPINVFWVIGNLSTNSVLITDYLTSNQYKGDRLRRVFPYSPYDYSIELSVNRTVDQRVYSCVIDGATDSETTLFTYIVRSIEIEKDDQDQGKSTSTILPLGHLDSTSISSLEQTGTHSSNNGTVDRQETTTVELFSTSQPAEDVETSSSI